MSDSGRQELMLLGRAIADLRLRAGLTQSQVGVFLGLSKKTVQQWEQGMRQPPLDDLCRMAGLYNVTAGDLFGSALDYWIPPTLELVEVRGSALRRPRNERKRHAAIEGAQATTGRVRNRPSPVRQ